jgi:hypothetical protein
MPGVAHTIGSTTHKEIHMSLEHIANSRARAGPEIRGVLVHEMVRFRGLRARAGGALTGPACTAGARFPARCGRDRAGRAD